MTKKIKVYIDVFYYQAALSGIRTYIYELFLGTKNSQSTKIEFIFSHNLEEWEHNHKYLNPKNRFLRWKFHFNYFIWKEIVLPFRILKHKPDVLICPDFVAPLWRFKTQKLCVIHDALFWERPKNYNPLWRKYFVKLIKLGLRGNSSVITTSNDAKNKLKNVFVKDMPIDVIFQSFMKSDIKDDLILKDLNLINSYYLLHVGSFDKRKDLITLVKAFKSLKDEVENKELKLVLVGQKELNGNLKILHRLESYIAQNNLSNDVLMPGYLTNEAVSALYESAFLYIFPSIDEGFGIPILEAFSAQTPVVTSNANALVEISGGAAVHFKSGDFVALSQVIKKLISSNKERTNLIEKGNERLKVFSREKFIEDYEKLILKSISH